MKPLLCPHGTVTRARPCDGHITHYRRVRGGKPRDGKPEKPEDWRLKVRCSNGHAKEVGYLTTTNGVMGWRRDVLGFLRSEPADYRSMRRTALAKRFAERLPRGELAKRFFMFRRKLSEEEISIIDHMYTLAPGTWSPVPWPNKEDSS